MQGLRIIACQDEGKANTIPYRCDFPLRSFRPTRPLALRTRRLVGLLWRVVVQFSVLDTGPLELFNVD